MEDTIISWSEIKIDTISTLYSTPNKPSKNNKKLKQKTSWRLTFLLLSTHIKNKNKP